MSLNKIMLIGNLGRDPETRYLPTGQAVCNFQIATSEKWTSNGEQKEHVEWHRVQVWGKQAEACQKYLVKGKQVYVEGRLRTEDYQAKDGQKKKAVKVVAQAVRFLGSKSDANGGSSNHSEFADDSREMPGDPAWYGQQSDDPDINF